MFYIKIKFLDHYMGCWWVDKNICDYSPFFIFISFEEKVIDDVKLS